MIKVQLWRSFSCNNSSSYYLVARFDSSDAASKAATELRQFLAVHGEQSDAMWQNDQDPTTTPTEASLALAEKHGFEWKGYLQWGDEGMSDWLPDVHVVGSDVMLYHYYCGGFGESIPKYFESIGAAVSKQSRENPEIAITFAVPSHGPGKAAADSVWAYVEGLRAMAASADGWVFSSSEPPPPWDAEVIEDMEFKCGAPFPSFNDGKTIGLILEISRPQEWDSIPAWFAGSGLGDYRFEIDRPRNIERFRTIGSAACPECQATPLEFIEAMSQSVPEDQLACTQCGGMFALADLTEVD